MTRTGASLIVSRVCNEHRNSDLRADNPAIIAAFDAEIERLDWELDRAWGMWHTAWHTASAERDAAQAEAARLREALQETTFCETCSGARKITLACSACLSGEYPGGPLCKCDKQQPEVCSQCEGAGRDYRGSELARAILTLPAPDAPTVASGSPEGKPYPPAALYGRIQDLEATLRNASGLLHRCWTSEAIDLVDAALADAASAKESA
jgi:hypothetical protein